MAAIDLKTIGTYAGIVGGAAGLIALVMNLFKWRWEARPDELTWEIDEHYVIDPARDRPRFPRLFQQQDPANGQTGIMVKATFHGRHSIIITGLSFEWNFNPHGQINVSPRTLQDGHSWEQLLFAQDIALDQVTSVTIEAEGGRRFRKDINLEYHRIFNAHVGAENP